MTKDTKQMTDEELHKACAEAQGWKSDVEKLKKDFDILRDGVAVRKKATRS